MLSIFEGTVKHKAGSKISRLLPSRLSRVRALLVSCPDTVELSLSIDGQTIMQRSEFARAGADGEYGPDNGLHEISFDIGKGRLTGMVRSKSGASQAVKIFIIAE